MKVAVLMGGRSSEREISLRTGQGVAQALRRLGHDVSSVDAADGALLPAGEEESGARPAAAIRGLPQAAMTAIATTAAIREADVVFVALHGPLGEDGTVQAMLELLDKPYTGSGVMASALAMNKALSKRIFEQVGVPTPAWALVEQDGLLHSLMRAGAVPPPIQRLGFPLIVKPNEEGSTVGLSIVHNPSELLPAFQVATDFGPQVLIEAFIEGRELTVAVVGDEALPIVEIRPKSGFYDYESKYTAGRSEYFCPADLPDDVAARVMELSTRAARALECRGAPRVDFRLDPEHEPYCLEVNTIPGMTPTSLVPMAAKASGMSYDALVSRMLDLAFVSRRRPAREPSKT